MHRVSRNSFDTVKKYMKFSPNKSAQIRKRDQKIIISLTCRLHQTRTIPKSKPNLLARDQVKCPQWQHDTKRKGDRGKNWGKMKNTFPRGWIDATHIFVLAATLINVCIYSVNFFEIPRLSWELIWKLIADGSLHSKKWSEFLNLKQTMRKTVIGKHMMTSEFNQNGAKLKL